jgi:methyl-accepting chemotaxis protein
MSESLVISIIVSVIVIPTMAILGFFLKATLKRIEDNLTDHVKNFNILNEKVNSINLSMVGINSSLNNIDRDLERANGRVSEMSKMLMDNAAKTIEYGHEINNIKAQMKMIAKELEECKESR